MDFKHPFITYPHIAVFYGIFWILFTVANVLIAVYGEGEDIAYATVQVIAFVIPYALLGAAIWYIIKYSSLEGNNVLRIIVAHLVAASVLVFLWLYIGMVIHKILQEKTIEEFNKSIPARLFTGYIFYFFFVLFFYAINYYHSFKEKLQNEGKLKTLVKEAELHALKSQINPHFLFNSLNSISSLTMTDPERAQQMVVNLSSLMRYSLKHDQEEEVSLGEELANNKLYLQIEKVRFGKKLNPVFDVEKACMNAKIPNMILQPLYENAIKYGVYETTDPIDITTTGRMKENVLEIIITNTYDSGVQSKKGEGIGLRNIRDRLQIIYGNPLLMKVEDNKKEFKVTLAIPQN